MNLLSGEAYLTHALRRGSIGFPQHAQLRLTVHAHDAEAREQQAPQVGAAPWQGGTTIGFTFTSCIPCACTALLGDIGPVMGSRMALCSGMTVSSSVGSNSSSGPYTDIPSVVKFSFCLPCSAACQARQSPPAQSQHHAALRHVHGTSHPGGAHLLDWPLKRKCCAERHALPGVVQCPVASFQKHLRLHCGVLRSCSCRAAFCQQ